MVPISMTLSALNLDFKVMGLLWMPLKYSMRSLRAICLR